MSEKKMDPLTILLLANGAVDLALRISALADQAGVTLDELKTHFDEAQATHDSLQNTLQQILNKED